MRALLAFSIFLTIHTVTTAQQFLLPAEGPFDQVRVAGNIHLQLIASNTMQLLFEEEAIPENLDVAWDENILTLKIPIDLKKTQAINVMVYYKTLSGLEIARGAVVQSADTLSTDNFSLHVENGGKAELYMVVDSLNARVTQGADIILRGTVRSQLIIANTGGNYLAYELEADNSWVKAATGAQVKISSSKFLEANATSKAYVGYLGNPEQKDLKTSLAGEITPQNQ